MFPLNTPSFDALLHVLLRTFRNVTSGDSLSNASHVVYML